VFVDPALAEPDQLSPIALGRQRRRQLLFADPFDLAGRQLIDAANDPKFLFANVILDDFAALCEQAGLAPRVILDRRRARREPQKL
jgi:hypothetical protein